MFGGSKEHVCFQHAQFCDFLIFCHFWLRCLHEFASTKKRRTDEPTSCPVLVPRRQVPSAMKQLLGISQDSCRVVHYNGTKESLTVYRLSPKSHSNSVPAQEALSVRVSAIDALCTHPTLPVVVAVASKTAPGTGAPTKDALSAQSSAPSKQKKISLTLYTHYSRAIVSTPLTIELDTEEPASVYPWGMKYSPCGKYLAVHAKSYRQSSSLPAYELFVFDSENNYSLVSSVETESGIEDMAWSSGSSSYIVAGATDGQLRVFGLNTADDSAASLSLLRSYNISSSPISSICYSGLSPDAASRTAKPNLRPELLVGTRDGNIFLVDPTTMTCVLADFIDVDLPVLSVSLGPRNIAVVTYLNEFSYAVQIEDGKTEKAFEIKDLYPTYNGGCGVYCTNSGTVVYINKDGGVSFQSLASMINRPKQSTDTGKSKRPDAKPAANPKKRALDLFDEREIHKSRNRPRNNDNDGLKKHDNYDPKREYWSQPRDSHNRDRYNKQRR